eukprot:m51a1_g1374 hypothetical protein (143) ;mRNA; r:432759-434001
MMGGVPRPVEKFTRAHASEFEARPGLRGKWVVFTSLTPVAAFGEFGEAEHMSVSVEGNPNSEWEQQYYDSVFRQSVERLELRRASDKQFTPDILLRTIETLYANQAAYEKSEVQMLREKATISAYELYLQDWHNENAEKERE